MDLVSGILDPAKMQGVQQLCDFAIQVPLKMTTRPGGQFAFRGTYTFIKREFIGTE